MTKIDFDKVALDYDKWVPIVPDSFVNQIFEFSKLRVGSPIVELGCGSGQLAIRFANRGLKVVGVDKSETLINIARKRDPKQKVFWVNCDAEIFMNDYDVDLCLIFESFHLFENKMRVLKNVEHYLSESGKICIGWCTYHWEDELKEIIVSTFNNHGLSWEDWGFQECGSVGDIIKQNSINFRKSGSACYEVDTKSDLNSVAMFLASIGKASILKNEKRYDLSFDLAARFKQIGDQMSGVTKYYLVLYEKS